MAAAARRLRVRVMLVKHVSDGADEEAARTWPRVGCRLVRRPGGVAHRTGDDDRDEERLSMDHHHVQDELRAPARTLREEIPEVLAAYAGLSRAAMAEGALSRKAKELIALAIAITRECDGCIAAHARLFASQGASRAEVAEMIGVAINMNGGPGTVWGPRALEAFDQFSADD